MCIEEKIEKVVCADCENCGGTNMTTKTYYSASYFEAEIEHVIAGAEYRINKIKEILDQYLFELEHYTK